MFVWINHSITDTKGFWEMAENKLPNLPADLKLHQAFATKEGNNAVCLWEAKSLETIETFMKTNWGSFAKNDIFTINEEKAVNLPKSLLTVAV